MSRKKAPADTRDVLLADIRARPDEDDCRLIYADWLEEHGSTEADRARAEFIRVQCRRASLGEYEPEWFDLGLREDDLLEKHREEWAKEVPWYARPGAVFRRGFVACVEGWRLNLRPGEADKTPLEGLRLKGPVRAAGVGPLFTTTFATYPGWRELVLRSAAVTTTDLRQLLQVEALARLRRLDLADNLLGNEGILVLVSCPLLRELAHLDISATACTPEDLGALLSSPNLPRLTSLFATDIVLGPLGAQFLARLPELDRLTALSLAAGYLHDAGASVLLPRPHLRHLDLSRNGLTPASLLPPAGGDRPGGLRSLRLRENAVHTEGVRLMVKSPHLAGLTVLDLSRAEVSEEGAAALATSGWSELRQLYLGSNGLADDGVQALSSSAMLARVTTLSLDGVGLTAGGVRALAHSPHLNNLRVLNLLGNNLRDEGAKALAEATGLPALRELDLTNCAIGPEGAEALARSPLLANLRVLNLRDNRIRAGGRALADSPHLESIRSLNLVGTYLSNDVKRALVQRFGDRVTTS